MRECPNGAYWAAFRPDGPVDDDVEAEDFAVEGTRLRTMWDEMSASVRPAKAKRTLPLARSCR